ncbi:hypothetical protein HD553DRAFT_343865 [Filobasidium floriforme]|uniref:uncharacterized protein n=1 Tax=Filobasidium floriforme TaxID=5210 RepID=UPI001E8EAB9E|nr:uncharacterized protein HD553DRAFT_343865 [Filobasidium floriforme]KAH8081790.1 hypothetical protein HD553DRAFT_343865 [Filobasidium floriforme]
MSTLPTPPATPQLRATTPGATPSLSSTTTTPPATPPHSPVSQLTPASTNTSLASNTTQATNAPPGTTSTAAATEKSKSPSVFSSIASSIFSTVSSILTYLGKKKEEIKEKMKSVFGFFYMRKPDPINPEAAEAATEKLKLEKQVAIGFELEAKQQGDLLNDKIAEQQKAARFQQLLDRMKQYLPKYYKEQVDTEFELIKKEHELRRNPV